MRRNDVVYRKADEFYSFYGRIVRVRPDGKIEWICCGGHCWLHDPDQIVKVDYKGRQEGRHFSNMTTIRKLKKNAQRYQGVRFWKKSPWEDFARTD